MNILELFQALEDADNELVEFLPDSHKDLMEDAKTKVDAYYFLLERFDEREESLRKLQKKTVERISKVMASRERVKDYLKFCARQFNIKKFTGNEFQFTVSTRKMVEITANPEDFKDHPFVRQDIKYRWSRPDVEMVFKTNPESLAGIAAEKDVESIRFNLRN